MGISETTLSTFNEADRPASRASVVRELNGGGANARAIELETNFRPQEAQIQARNEDPGDVAKRQLEAGESLDVRA